jgi:hypothetical protein
MREIATPAPDARLTRSDAPARNDVKAVKHERDAHSACRALQVAPLARLAANGAEHAHVRAVAILGYN